MKRALIVDDSRLARHVLSRLLTEHGVAADTAQSAEAALDYLKERRPDVVFLDHLMPGMDGFEALEAIKANPVTATIPVMMYTSQEGELYLGQARALGALGVLPKSMQPVEVTKVLRSLHLIPTDSAQSIAPPHDPANSPLDAHRLRELLEELFYEQGAALRDEVRKELQRLSAAAPAAAPAATPAPVAQVERRAATPFQPHIFKIASAVLLLLSVVLGYLYIATSSLLEQAHQRTQTLVADTAALSAASAHAFDVLQTPSDDGPGVLDVLQWGANQGDHYAFGEVPLGENRAYVLTALLEELERINFVGTVAIDVHVGRFCMNYGLDGNPQLAPPDQPAATCEQIGWPELEAVAMGKQQSLAFANAVATASARNPGLRFETISHGTSEPTVEYPPSGYEVTAGAWNAIAANNQRVGIRLVGPVRSGGRR